MNFRIVHDPGDLETVNLLHVTGCAKAILPPDVHAERVHLPRTQAGFLEENLGGRRRRRVRVDRLHELLIDIDVGQSMVRPLAAQPPHGWPLEYQNARAVRPVGPEFCGRQPAVFPLSEVQDPPVVRRHDARIFRNGILGSCAVVRNLDLVAFHPGSGCRGISGGLDHDLDLVRPQRQHFRVERRLGALQLRRIGVDGLLQDAVHVDVRHSSVHAFGGKPADAGAGRVAICE